MPPHAPHSLSLPDPSPDERAISARVNELIHAEIERGGGAIAFSRFMELALYAPGLGYYSAGQPKLGAGGDFITAPESFPLFGRCLARAAAQVLDRLGAGDILEAGAGSGRLAAVILNELAACGTPARSYSILELSADLRRRQETVIEELAPAQYSKVRWLDELPPPGFRGLVLANELLDAMPVERFRIEAPSVARLGVTWREDRFDWAALPAPTAMRERVEPLNLPAGYTSEIGFAAEAWIRSIGERIGAGTMLIIDYGFPRAEFYHPDRAAGTLMCHYRHRAHADPLILAGLQDITAHVDFTAIAEAGAEVGLELLGYTSQAAFLIGSGLEEFARASDPNDVRAHLGLTEQIKKLTLPHEMGELYKVIALGRGSVLDMDGFKLQDRRERLRSG